MVDLDDAGRTWELPIPGEAHFVTAPIDIGALVIPPTSAALQLRADGLGVVTFGDPDDGFHNCEDVDPPSLYPAADWGTTVVTINVG